MENPRLLWVERRLTLGGAVHLDWKEVLRCEPGRVS